MSIYFQGNVCNPNQLLWFENSTQKEALRIEKIMCADRNVPIYPLSMNTLEKLVGFISLTGILSDKVTKNDSLEQEGFGWVKTFHALVTLCNHAEPHGNFNVEKAKVIFSKCLQNLLSKGFDLNAPLLWQGTNPLHQAASQGCAVLCNVLVTLGANIEEPRDAWTEKTPLHVAASAEKINVVRELIKLGANVHASAKDNNIGQADKPIHCAAYDAEIIQLLWENGADINAKSMDTTHGPTPLEKAVKGGRHDATKKLLELGANENASHFEMLRKEIVKNICWQITSFGYPENKIAAWASITVKIAGYINTLIVLNNHQFCSGSQNIIKINEFSPIKLKNSLSYNDWEHLISTVKKINKELLNQDQCDHPGFWIHKTEVICTHTNHLIQTILLKELENI